MTAAISFDSWMYNDARNAGIVVHISRNAFGEEWRQDNVSLLAFCNFAHFRAVVDFENLKFKKIHVLKPYKIRSKRFVCLFVCLR